MNIAEMPAGREMDALVAEKVMGWTDTGSTHGKTFGRPPKGNALYETVGNIVRQVRMPRYSTDIGMSWEVVQILNQQGYSLRLVGPEVPDMSGYLFEEKWSAAFVKPQYAFTDIGQDQGKGATPSLAICRAALKLMEGKGN